MKINNTKDTSAHHPLIQWIEHHVRRAVRKVNLQLARCSMTGQIALCLIAVVAIAFANAGILWHALHEKQGSEVLYESISFPSVDTAENDSILTHEEYAKLILFNEMLDSLQRSPAGKSIYNELVGSHPGLRDSINYLLKYFPPKK